MRNTTKKNDINETLESRGLELVDEYAGAMTKVTFRCKIGHLWLSKPNNILNGNGCPHCYGNVRYTKETLNKLLSPRSITVISEPNGNLNFSTFECGAGHQWKAQQGSVISGRGCPHCSKRVRHTKESVNATLADRGIVMVGECKGALKATQFRCNRGHIWSCKPDAVLHGHGCPHCAGNAKITAEVFAARLVGKNIKALTSFEGNEIKMLFECGSQHQWYATPLSIHRGSGCPACATSGFDPNKPATFYVYSLTTADNICFIGYGITNVPKVRMAQHKANFKKHKATGELIHHFTFSCGEDVRTVERSVAKMLQSVRVSSGITGFIKEAIIYSEENLQKLLGILQYNITKSSHQAAQTRANKRNSTVRRSKQ